MPIVPNDQRAVMLRYVSAGRPVHVGGYAIHVDVMPLAPPFFVNQPPKRRNIVRDNLELFRFPPLVRIRFCPRRPFPGRYRVRVMVSIPGLTGVATENVVLPRCDDLYIQPTFLDEAANDLDDTAYETIGIAMELTNYPIEIGSKNTTVHWSHPIAVLAPSVFVGDMYGIDVDFELPWSFRLIAQGGKNALRALTRGQQQVGTDDDSDPMLAAFVTPREPAVLALVDAAADGADCFAQDPDFQCSVDMAGLLFDAIYKVGLASSLPASTFVRVDDYARYYRRPYLAAILERLDELRHSFQGSKPVVLELARPALPREVLRDKTFECVSGALLFSSVLEAASMFPVLVIIETAARFHVMVAVLVPKPSQDVRPSAVQEAAKLVMDKIFWTYVDGKQVRPDGITDQDADDFAEYTAVFFETTQLRRGGGLLAALRSADKNCEQIGRIMTSSVRVVSIYHARATQAIVPVPSIRRRRMSP